VSLDFIGFFGFLMCFLVLWPSASPAQSSRAQPVQHSSSQLSPAWQRQLGRIQSSQDSEEIIDIPKQQFLKGSSTVKKSLVSLRNLTDFPHSKKSWTSFRKFNDFLEGGGQ